MSADISQNEAIELIDSLIVSPGSLAIEPRQPLRQTVTTSDSSKGDDDATSDGVDNLFARNKSVRTYLHLLGYLRKDNSDPHLTRPLKRALRKFQEEAGLLVDEWVGKKTWLALQTLVSFEAGDRIDLWVGKDEKQAAMNRAINLRLHVLGFLDKRQFASTQSTNQALETFYQHALKVGQVSQFRPNAQTGWLRHKKLIRALFDAQGILTSTSRYQVEKSVTLPVSINLAKIELFLLGYDVQPTRSRTYKMSTADVNRFAFFRRNPASVSSTKANQYKLYEAMQNFAQSQGVSTIRSASTSRKVDYQFIAQLAALHHQNELSQTQQAKQVLLKISESKDANTHNKIWEHINSIGGRIFDGVKRVIKWFASIVNSTIKDTSETLKNIARLTHMLASDGLKVIKDSAKQIKRGVQFLKRSPVQGSSADDWYTIRSKNCDYVVLINHQASANVIDKKTRHFRKQLSDFKLAMQNVRKVIKGLKIAISFLKFSIGLGTGVKGFAALLGLVRVFI